MSLQKAVRSRTPGPTGTNVVGRNPFFDGPSVKLKGERKADFSCSQYSQTFLKCLLWWSGNRSALIVDGNRSYLTQAETMYANIVKNGLSAEYGRYGPIAEKVLEVFEYERQRLSPVKVFIKTIDDGLGNQFQVQRPIDKRMSSSPISPDHKKQIIDAMRSKIESLNKLNPDSFTHIREGDHAIDVRVRDLADIDAFESVVRSNCDLNNRGSKFVHWFYSTPKGKLGKKTEVFHIEPPRFTSPLSGWVREVWHNTLPDRNTQTARIC